MVLCLVACLQYGCISPTPGTTTRGRLLVAGAVGDSEVRLYHCAAMLMVCDQTDKESSHGLAALKLALHRSACHHMVGTLLHAWHGGIKFACMGR